MCVRAHALSSDVKKIKNNYKVYIAENMHMFKKQIDFSHIFNLPNSASECQFTETQHACVNVLNIEFEDPCGS